MSDQSSSESEFEEPEISSGGKRKRKLSGKATRSKKSRRASTNCSPTAPLSEYEIILSYNSDGRLLIDHGVEGFGRILAAALSARSQRVPSSTGDAIRFEWGLPAFQQVRNSSTASGDFTRDQLCQNDAVQTEQAYIPPKASGDFTQDPLDQSDTIQTESEHSHLQKVNGRPTLSEDTSHDYQSLSDFYNNEFKLLTSREYVDLAVNDSSSDNSAPNEWRSRSNLQVHCSLLPSEDVGYNLLDGTPSNSVPKRSGPRPIIIDGSNIAFSHGRGRFSSRGLEICVNFFVRRKHLVFAIVPLFRRSHNQTQDPQILAKLEKAGHLVYTPSRWVENKLIVPYDDRYIVQCAALLGGVIVSRDNYRDIMKENPIWKKTITENLLMYTWVGDILIFPLDPLGRNGPKLQKFLEF